MFTDVLMFTDDQGFTWLPAQSSKGVLDISEFWGFFLFFAYPRHFLSFLFFVGFVRNWQCIEKKIWLILYTYSTKFKFLEILTKLVHKIGVKCLV